MSNPSHATRPAMHDALTAFESWLRHLVSTEIAKHLPVGPVAPADPAPPPFEWVSQAEAMRLLGVSRSKLYRLRKAGHLPSKHLGSGVYFRRADLSALIEHAPSFDDVALAMVPSGMELRHERL